MGEMRKKNQWPISNIDWFSYGMWSNWLELLECCIAYRPLSSLELSNKNEKISVTGLANALEQ